MITDKNYLEQYDKDQKRNIKELLALMIHNPDLPVVCQIDACGMEDYCQVWLASIGSSRVVEYIAVDMNAGVPESVFKGETGYYENFLRNTKGMTDQEVKEHIDNIDWIKAILVDIDIA